MRLTTASEGHQSMMHNGAKHLRKTLKKTSQAIMRSYRFKLPKYDLPIRLRPWFLLFTSLIMVMLAFLGFTNFARSLPLNDKLLHLVCLCLATGVFYFIFDVEEDARRVWIWRHAGLILTGIICFFFGGVVSEIVQSLLPYKEFQAGDVAANLLGSAIGLWVAYYLERYYRKRREISRLYRPVSSDPNLSPESDEEDASGTMLLPSHYTLHPLTPNLLDSGPSKPNSKADGRSKIGDVWDEQEELFGIEDSDDDDESPARRPALGPKIVITSS